MEVSRLEYRWVGVHDVDEGRDGVAVPLVFDLPGETLVLQKWLLLLIEYFFFTIV